jgi:hypothetical protein
MRTGRDTTRKAIKPMHENTSTTTLAARMRSQVMPALLGVVATVVLAAVPATAQAAFGENFGFAPVVANGTDAPAFAPNDRAWYAGVCDLNDPSTTNGGVGTSSGPYAHCLEHQGGTLGGVGGVTGPGGGFDHLLPPLAPGVAAGNSGPDGWINASSRLVQGGPAWRLDPVTSGAARADGSAAFWLTRSPDQLSGAFTGSSWGADGAPKSIVASLPPGVVGNPTAVPKCPSEAVRVVPTRCPPKTQVGVSTITVGGRTSVHPVYNVEPRDGKTAEFIISGAGFSDGLITNVPVVGRARTEGDFGIDAFASEVPSGLALGGQTFTFWAVPWARSHDRYRPVAHYCGDRKAAAPKPDSTNTRGMAVTGLRGNAAAGSSPCSQEPQSYDPSWGPIKPFIATQTECSPTAPVTRVAMTSWYVGPSAVEAYAAPPVTDCANIPFDASMDLQQTGRRAGGPTGLEVGLEVPQNNEPPAAVRSNPCDEVGSGCPSAGAPAYWKSQAGRASAHLDKTVVKLPAGLSVNPSAASGLESCSDGQVGVTALGNPPTFNNGDPFNKDGGVDGAECPGGSVIGTAEVETPLLEETLTGELVLGAPKSTNPVSGEMFRLFIVLRNRERAVIAKVYGTSTADGTIGEGGSGQLIATFDENPQIPFDQLRVSLKGGQRGLLANPQQCVSRDWSVDLTPWSAAHGAGGQATTSNGAFTTSEDCAFGFNPTLATGMDTTTARSSGTFSFRFSRQDGEQWLRGLTARLSQGLLASVKDVPLCANAQADAGACPAGSKIGIVDAKAGAGDPFVLEQKGEVFLTEGYKGGEYGLAVKIRPIAGPFRGAMELSPIIVRQAIHVDRTSAQVTAVSDPFPLVHHGVPLRVREVTVLVNRGGFMLNPSDCTEKQIGADIHSDQGASTGLANGFQPSNCATLAFKPKLALRLTGRKQIRTGKHPGIKAVVTQQGVPEAGIEKAVVRLPKSLALDVNNARALCEFVDGTKPDLEDHCPKGSIVGRARAVSPLLKKPLVGNVYFVKNIRTDPKTGNEIRTLPMIIVALRGEISVNLKGESDTQKGKLVNTFDNVPDAPITRFNLNIRGGSKGIIAVTRTRRSLINICATGRQTAEADMDGQNGRRHDRDIAMRKPCTKRQTKAAKRQAKRAAAKRTANR